MPNFQVVLGVTRTDTRTPRDQKVLQDKAGSTERYCLLRYYINAFASNAQIWALPPQECVTSPGLVRSALNLKAAGRNVTCSSVTYPLEPADDTWDPG